MKAFGAFVKKELLEMARSYKLFIMGLIFFLLGVMNPITARLTPQLLESFMPEVTITVAEPSAADAWMQFYKNVPQMGLVVLVILFSGFLASEYSKGTLIIMVTKGLSRKIVLLSKFTSAVLLWTGAYAICFLTSYGYTEVLFEEGFEITKIILAAVFLWLYGIMLLASNLLGSVLFRNAYGSLLFTGGFVVVQFLFSIVPAVKEHSPLVLITENLQLLTGEIKAGDFMLPVVLTVAAAAVFVAAACLFFHKKEL